MSQTLPFEQWELLLIDNASEQKLSTKLDLSWHSNARHIQETQLGLTHARLRGIREAQGEILVFVDDDNVLELDYLEITLQISKSYPMVGSWGGQIKAVFEEEPPEWAKPYLPYLAIREFNQDQWSNFSYMNESTPCGAGLCVRKAVAEKYAELIHSDPKRAGLGRKGKVLTSCEDSDLALVACDIGLGMGQFKALKLTHLIPSSRLQEEYLIKLTESMVFSKVILDSLRGKYPQKPSWGTQIKQYYKRSRKSAMERRFHDAVQRGYGLALKTLSSG
jgi:glycosyltransferase involved in cell wall biosynthesis